jgi:hypothetical protein
LIIRLGIGDSSVDAFELAILNKPERLNKLEKDFLRHEYESPQSATEDVAEAWLEKAWEISGEAFRLQNELLVDLRETTNLVIHNALAKRTLEKVRKEETFYSTSFFKALAEMLNSSKKTRGNRIPTSVTDFPPDDMFDEFHSGFSLTLYYLAKIKIGPIISASKIPDNLDAYFEEVKEAYAFGLYRSSVALSRAILEMSLFDKLKRAGFFKEQKVVQMQLEKEDKLSRFINEAKWQKILNSENAELAHKVREAANRVMHTREKEAKPKEEQPLEIIFNTIRVIEWLYR